MTYDPSGGTLVRQRLAWERDFTQLPNVYARDKRLSWVARGILAWLMTHGDGFQITMRQLEGESWKEGREALRSAIAELEKLGYLHRQETRGRGGQKGAYRWYLLDPFQLPTVDAPQLPIGSLMAVDNSPSTSDGFPSVGATKRRVAVDGNPSTNKNTNRRTSTDPAQPQGPLDAPVDNRGAVVWSDDRCPGNWRDGRHELGEHGMCRHCHVRPSVRSAS